MSSLPDAVGRTDQPTGDQFRTFGDGTASAPFAQGVTACDGRGQELPHRFANTHPPRAVRVSSSGSTTLYTPAAGAAVRLHWIGLSTAESASAVLAVVKLAGGGLTDRYRWNLGAGGAFMRTGVVEGDADAELELELDAAVDVEVSFEVEEFTP